MNSLGLAYASSSEDEGELRHEQDVAVKQMATTPAVRIPQPDQRETAESVALADLPASPPGAANPEVQARIARFLALQQRYGHDSSGKPVKKERNRGGSGEGGGSTRSQSFQENLQSKKEVANPYILDKVVAYFGIDELQTNFGSDVFDPYALPLHEYTDKIASEQKKQQERTLARQQQEQMQGTRTGISFVPGSR